MRTPARTALGGSIVSTLAIGGIVAAGVVADPSAPSAGAATALTTFEDCDALQSWYVTHTIDQVGPYGWGGRAWTMLQREAPTQLSGQDSSSSGSGSTSAPQSGAERSAPQDAVANGATGTNTQEAGVDEPDVAKTDGRIVVRLLDGRRLVITDVTGTSPREIADWRLPDGAYADGLLLVGHHVLLAGGSAVAVDQAGGTGLTEDAPEAGVRGRVMTRPPGTRLIDLDITDPAHPRLDSTTSWSGSQLSLRQYGGTVRLVTSTGLPQLPFVQPRPGRLTEQEAEQRNREIVRSSTVGDWLPGTTSEPGGTRSLVACDRVYHPRTWSGAETVAVATFEPGAVEEASTVAVTGAGAEVYSSTDRLYVVSNGWDTSTSSFREPTGRTHLHAFALDGSTTRYVASGTVDGTIRDRWSLDEHDGHLRAAVSWPDGAGNGSRDNGIVVLDERGGALEQVGELRGLGPDEDIQSVRWFDDLAVVVTFRQTDPLHTVDLSDPADPRLAGELRIPGFSSYLHPIGGDRLLGLGTDATLDGQSLGAQAGVFDIGNPAQARQIGKVTFGQGTRLGASDDAHAFTWLPDASAAITSLQGQGSSDPGLVLLRVSAAGTVSVEDLPSPGGWQPRALPLQGGRVALVGSRVEVADLGR